AACGCVGLKPTFGELPCDGIIPLSRSLDHVGPLARCVRDARLLFHAMRGPAPLNAAAGAVGAGNGAQTKGLTLGILRPFFMDVLDDHVAAATERALAALRRAGLGLAERLIPHAGDTATIYLHLQLPEASAYHAAAVEAQPDAYTPPVRLRLEMGRYVLAEDYVRAQQGAEVLRREVDAALDGCDALVLPTLPIVAQPIGSNSMEIGGTPYPIRGLMLRLTQLFDITGHPAISLPCGRLGRDALPVALQLVGRRNRTDELLDVAEAVEDVVSTED
ncbi:MAG: amidase, partial [Acidobacteria bacterium]